MYKLELLWLPAFSLDAMYYRVLNTFFCEKTEHFFLFVKGKNIFYLFASTMSPIKMQPCVIIRILVVLIFRDTRRYSVCSCSFHQILSSLFNMKDPFCRMPFPIQCHTSALLDTAISCQSHIYFSIFSSKLIVNHS